MRAPSADSIRDRGIGLTQSPDLWLQSLPSGPPLIDRLANRGVHLWALERGSSSRARPSPPPSLWTASDHVMNRDLKQTGWLFLGVHALYPHWIEGTFMFGLSLYVCGSVNPGEQGPAPPQSHSLPSRRRRA